MKKRLLAGIMTLIFAGTCVPTVFASSVAVTDSTKQIAYSFVDNSTQNGTPTFNTQVNKPVGNPTWGNITVKPNTGNNNPVKPTDVYKKPNSNGKVSGNKHRPHKNKQHKTPGKYKPNKPNNGTYKPSQPTGVYKPNRPNNGTYKPNQPTGVYKPNKPNNGTYKPNQPTGVYKPNNGTYKPNQPTGVYKPNKPNNGTYKPGTIKPSTGSRTKVHGAHWCYGACSLHDAGLHNAPRTQKHWCDGYR